MTREIATDILAHRPISEPVSTALAKNHFLSAPYLNATQQHARTLIQHDMDDLDTMIDMSRDEVRNPIVGYHDDYDPSDSTFGSVYAFNAASPVAKMEYDSERIGDFMRKLGPTNTLRREDGLDAGYDLATLKRLLERDYEAVPEGSKKPEMRMTEALIAEELALLWQPDMLGSIGRLPVEKQQLIANTYDVNVLSQRDIAHLSERDRWKIIGANVATEAANLFREIAASPSATVDARLESLVRSTDMTLRASRAIGSSSTLTKEEKQAFAEESAKTAAETYATIVDAWQSGVQGITRGKLFELLLVVYERRQIELKKESNRYIRLAMPREDQISPALPPLRDFAQTRINLSADAIIEDGNGHFVQGLQAKAMREDAYLEQKLRREQSDGYGRTYAAGRIAMRFLGDVNL